MKSQYLSESNRYESQLISLAKSGLTWIVRCTDEAMEPAYEGFETNAAAQKRAAVMREHTGDSHDVIQLTCDEDGDWQTTYAPVSPSDTITVFSEVSIVRAYDGVGRWKRGEVNVSPSESWSSLSDMESSWGLVPLAEALTSAEFIAAGIEDLRGMVQSEPEHLYASLESGAVRYHGVVETEVPASFFGR